MGHGMRGLGRIQRFKEWCRKMRNLPLLPAPHALPLTLMNRRDRTHMAHKSADRLSFGWKGEMSVNT